MPSFTERILFLIFIGIVLCKGEYLDPHCNGKQVIVHLFEWKWSEIAKECERFLGPWGFCGVQLSPPMEHVVITSPPYPWWQRYQPVSYKLVSRSGNEEQFADMAKRCNAVGVRIFVDSVVNHMSGTENKGQGSGGTSFDGPSLSYPGVPYSAQNFNPRSKCPSGDGHVNNYGDPNNVRNCYLLSLSDLDQSQDYVRKKIIEYYNHLIDLGVAGFRVDASKHMWPQDIAAIQAGTKDTQFGGKPFYYHEVIDQNDGAIKVNEYYSLGRVTEFRYCQKIKMGIENFGELGGVYDPGWGMADDDHAFVFVDNHDNQRGHGGGGQILTHEKPLEYRLAVAFTLAWKYGFTRVMSSYSFGDNSDQGPPHNSDYSTADVPINSDGSCGGGWVCEHRWPSIRGMALFRNAVAGTEVRNYYNQGDVVAFTRGNKGFFIMGKRGFDQQVQTGLSAGQYCDLISNCQQKITVDGSGNARVRPYSNSDPVVAIIQGGPTGPIQEGSVGTSSGGNQGSSGTATTASPAVVTTPKATSTPEPCEDKYTDDCSEFEGQCDNEFVGRICPKYCGKCQLPPPCEDKYTGDCKEFDGHCTDLIVQHVCPKFCGICTPAATNAPATSASATNTVSTSGSACESGWSTAGADAKATSHLGTTLIPIVTASR
ncbi:alpha-amylase-like isoform X1 [Pomacea canaliculata]|uniref:alpha-amylase-like isoform X1 n=1 Tax=Pomacea canaliculata TaxID=400727 RepID=UPI000D733F5B|nr:alpha-amylase-like isoform X1 [Pomacea canaliculata]XP_025086170.1 alpha-amylase-like isoform X1 [Pomacea canaliculata]